MFAKLIYFNGLNDRPHISHLLAHIFLFEYIFFTSNTVAAPSRFFHSIHIIFFLSVLFPNTHTHTSRELQLISPSSSSQLIFYSRVSRFQYICLHMSTSIVRNSMVCPPVRRFTMNLQFGLIRYLYYFIIIFSVTVIVWPC